MIIQTAEQLQELKNSISSSKLVAVDTETNWTNRYAERFPIGIAVSTDDRDAYIPVGHSGLFGDNFKGELPDDLFMTDGTLVMHNASFDLNQLRDYKFRLENLVDTMMMHHHIDEYRPHDLEKLGEDRLGRSQKKELKELVAKFRKMTGGNEMVPVPPMADYAMNDTRTTYLLYKQQLPEWQIYRDLWETTDRPFLQLLTELEHRGLIIDQSRATALSNAANRRLLELHQELGFDPMKSSILENKLFSLPPVGLGLKPRKYGASGRPTMDEAYLSSIGHPVTAMVVEYRGLVKMKSSYYDAYIELAQVDGRLHPTFKQHGTLTGRLSCEKPNLQQIPRDVDTSPVKKLFLPEDGCQLWEFDYSALEARLAAVYAKDPTMVEVFRSGGDIHQTTANKVAVNRQIGKTINFALIYGGTEYTLVEKCGLSPKSARGIWEEVRKQYPRIFETAAKAEIAAENSQYVKMWSGRRRHFRYPSEYRKAFNAIIQGGGSDICKHGMINLHKAGYSLANQVHDSVWVNIPHNEVQNALVEIPKLMCDWAGEAFGLPFPVDAKRLN